MSFLRMKVKQRVLQVLAMNDGLTFRYLFI